MASRKSQVRPRIHARHILDAWQKGFQKVLTRRGEYGTKSRPGPEWEDLNSQHCVRIDIGDGNMTFTHSHLASIKDMIDENLDSLGSAVKVLRSGWRLIGVKTDLSPTEARDQLVEQGASERLGMASVSISGWDGGYKIKRYLIIGIPPGYDAPMMMFMFMNC